MKVSERQRLYKKRMEAGLCTRCAQPNSSGTQRCDECRLKHTLYTRNKRQAENKNPVARCTLCTRPGHTYPTCKLNPDSIQ